MTFITPMQKVDEEWNFNSTTIETELAMVNKLKIEKTPISSPKIYYAYDNKGNLTITKKPTAIDFDQVYIADPNYTNNNGIITIQEEGIYFISFTIVTGSNGFQGSARGTLHSYIEIDQGDGFSIFPGSKVSNYMREQREGITDYLVTKTIPIKILKPNSKLRIMCLNESTTTSSITQKEESTIFINKLRPL